MVTIDPTYDEVSTPWGARLMVDSNDRSHGGHFLATGVSWPEELARLAVWARPGATIVDVGASFGYLASLFAHGVGPDGQVIAFEATGDAFGLLADNMRRNHPGVHCRHVAISDRDGRETIYLDRTYHACHSVASGLLPSYSGESEEVDALTLDSALSALEAGQGPIDLLKIDVEGAEGRVLAGATRTLERVHRVWVEFWPAGLQAAGSDPRTVLDDLVGSGFTLTYVDLVTGEGRSDVGPDDVLAYCGELAGSTVLADDPQPLYDLVYLLAERRR
ncbi:FkbM family methyltransferase [Streptomyces sp. NPDC048290]|uniref:FkbM family methyltransferase n=1 Tax=Streptomyces sp. NPDC048290 TaxID=3155811 RepID=UPI0034167C56